MFVFATLLSDKLHGLNFADSNYLEQYRLITL